MGESSSPLVWEPREESDGVGEVMGEVGRGKGKLVISSSSFTGHFSSRECLTEVQPRSMSTSAPAVVLEMRHKA